MLLYARAEAGLATGTEEKAGEDSLASHPLLTKSP